MKQIRLLSDIFFNGTLNMQYPTKYRYRARAMTIKAFKASIHNDFVCIYSYNTLVAVVIYNNCNRVTRFIEVGYGRYSATTSRQLTQFIRENKQEFTHIINVEDKVKYACYYGEKVEVIVRLHAHGYINDYERDKLIITNDRVLSD